MVTERPIFVPHSRWRRLLALLLAAVTAVAISRLMASPRVTQAYMLALLALLALLEGLGAQTGGLVKQYQGTWKLVGPANPSPFVIAATSWAPRIVAVSLECGSMPAWATGDYSAPCRSVASAAI